MVIHVFNTTKIDGIPRISLEVFAFVFFIFAPFLKVK